MAYPTLTGVSPRQERRLRREWKAEYREQGLAYPTLHTIGFVELDAIRLPAWSYAKRIPGLSWSDKSVWLRRILARKLFSEDERAGGHPKITFAPFRPCKLCKRPLIGGEAEYRFQLDLKIAGWCIPCGPDCEQAERLRLESQRQKRGKVELQQVNRQDNRKGK